MTKTRENKAISLGASALILIILFLTVGFGLFLTTGMNSQTSTGDPPSCSGYPPGGNCPGTYSHSFTITVNYTGLWSLKYYGYHLAGDAWLAEVGAPGSYLQGSHNGTGSGSIGVAMSGPNNIGLTLCAFATKLDSSNNTLTLSIIGQNSTSVPYGSTYLCNTVVP